MRSRGRSTPQAGEGFWRPTTCGVPPPCFGLSLGLGRIFFGGREPSFYWRNGLFWVKLGLFGLVFALELAPMTTFIRVRIAQRRGAALPAFPVDTYRRINATELWLVVAIVFVAAFMARGAWMF